VVLHDGLKAERITQLHVEQLLSFADPAPLLVGLRDLGTDDVEQIKCILWCVFRRPWPALLPFLFDVFDPRVALLLLLNNLGLEGWNLALHEGNLLGEDLLEGLIPLELDDVDP
jgi:hypothetical protein